MEEGEGVGVDEGEGEDVGDREGNVEGDRFFSGVSRLVVDAVSIRYWSLWRLIVCLL